MADIFNMADTWNNAGTTFTAIKMNITDTTSNVASLLMNLQIGGTDYFRVFKNYRSGNTSTGIEVRFGSDGNANGGVIGFDSYSMYVWVANSLAAVLSNTGTLGLTKVTFGTSSANPDMAIERTAATVFVLTNNSTGGACLEFREQTPPSAPATNVVRLFAEDNGGGKTRLMARFATGASQQIAIEP
jgi:hypothetical protein